jgi:hypothetical protein
LKTSVGGRSHSLSFSTVHSGAYFHNIIIEGPWILKMFHEHKPKEEGKG